MKKKMSLLLILSLFGLTIFGGGCSMFVDKYAIEHKQQNDNAWLEKKHGYRDVANYESEKFEQRKGRH